MQEIALFLKIVNDRSSCVEFPEASLHEVNSQCSLGTSKGCFMSGDLEICII